MKRISDKMVEPLETITTIPKITERSLAEWADEKDIALTGIVKLNLAGSITIFREKLFMNADGMIEGVTTEAEGGGVDLHIIKPRANENQESLKGWTIKNTRGVYRKALEA